MYYEDLQLAIVNRLAPDGVNQGKIIAVEAPQVSGDIGNKAAIGRITVTYIGSKFSKGNSEINAIVAQTETIHIGVSCQSKLLYGDFGVYWMLEYIEAALLGFRPKNPAGQKMCERLYLADYGTDINLNGIHTHEVIFAAERQRIQAENDEEGNTQYAAHITKLTATVNIDNPEYIVAPPPQTYPYPPPPSSAVGDLSAWDGIHWVRVAPGTDGEVLTTHGPGTLPTWEPGAAGAFERRHSIAGLIDYCGTAPDGSAESAAVWSIVRITCAIDGTAIVATATGVKWTERLTISYN